MTGEWETDGGIHCDLPAIPEDVEPGAIWRCECGQRWRVLWGTPKYGWVSE